MIKSCEFCFRDFETNNKHRTSCYECKEKYPYVASSKGSGAVFNRTEIMRKDKFSKLVNPEKRTRWNKEIK